MLVLLDSLFRPPAEGKPDKGLLQSRGSLFPGDRSSEQEVVEMGELKMRKEVSYVQSSTRVTLAVGRLRQD